MGDVFTNIEKREASIVGTTRSGEVLMADQILFAIGRSPNTRSLGLETAGVKLDAVGAVVVDTFSQSNVPSIFAVGDVTNRVNLTPVAIREGHAFADTQFGGKPWSTSYENIPTAVFTTPEIGTVGCRKRRRAHVRRRWTFTKRGSGRCATCLPAVMSART